MDNKTHVDTEGNLFLPHPEEWSSHNYFIFKKDGTYIRSWNTTPLHWRLVDTGVEWKDDEGKWRQFLDLSESDQAIRQAVESWLVETELLSD